LFGKKAFDYITKVLKPQNYLYGISRQEYNVSTRQPVSVPNDIPVAGAGTVRPAAAIGPASQMSNNLFQ
jgi:hypothetical protein